ncbi:cofilin-like [Dendronephthya gigantea]|uniref:cofilin-like n=1 Tax=Dendronephthya gigantea TaxID=151771 RepID=UPI00106C50C0|nr:cofilin-like [Dendronephthya gigantea]
MGLQENARSSRDSEKEEGDARPPTSLAWPFSANIWPLVWVRLRCKEIVNAFCSIVQLKMASSGIEVDSDLKDDFIKMKQKNVYGMLVMQLSDDKKRIVKQESMSRATCTPEELVEFFSSLEKDKCFYVLYDHKKTNKLILIKWAPDTAKAAAKMIFASTWDAVKKSFDGSKPLEASDLDEVSEAELDRLSRKV